MSSAKWLLFCLGLNVLIEPLRLSHRLSLDTLQYSIDMSRILYSKIAPAGTVDFVNFRALTSFFFRAAQRPRRRTPKGCRPWEITLSLDSVGLDSLIPYLPEHKLRNLIIYLPLSLQRRHSVNASHITETLLVFESLLRLMDPWTLWRGIPGENWGGFSARMVSNMKILSVPRRSSEIEITRRVSCTWLALCCVLLWFCNGRFYQGFLQGYLSDT